MDECAVTHYYAVQVKNRNSILGRVSRIIPTVGSPPTPVAPTFSDLHTVAEIINGSIADIAVYVCAGVSFRVPRTLRRRTRCV